MSTPASQRNPALGLAVIVAKMPGPSAAALAVAVRAVTQRRSPTKLRQFGNRFQPTGKAWLAPTISAVDSTAAPRRSLSTAVISANPLRSLSRSGYVPAGSACVSR